MRWEVACFDPNGNESGTLMRSFFTRRGAEREKRKYEKIDPFLVRVPSESGARVMVPLVNYRVRRKT